jgi:hypothetical protein
MTLSLLANPDKLVDGIQSNVNGGITQLPYTFLRADVQTLVTRNNGGNVQIDASSANVALITVGTKIYWQPDPQGFETTPYVEGFYTVLSKGTFDFTIDLAYISDTTVSGHANLTEDRPDYNVQVIVEETASPNAQTVPFIYVPSQSGQLFVDLGPAITAVMEQNSVATYNYRILYRENYNGNDLAYVQDADIQAILGEQSIGQTGGSNLSKYLPNIDPLGKPLTFFASYDIKKWRGWAQTYSFIFDSRAVARTGTANNELRVIQISRDINSVTVAVIGNTPYTGASTIHETAILDDPAYYVELALKDNLSLGNFIERLFYKYEDECKNPIMVTWVNSLGVSEYYLFEIAQEVLLNATEGLVYQQSRNQDISNVNRQKIRLSSDETLRIVCRAEKLTQNDIRALHELKTSEKVEVYLNKDGSKRVGVIVSEGFATNYDTDDPLNEFTVVLEFPEDYNDPLNEFTVVLEFPEDYKFFDVKEY